MAIGWGIALGYKIFEKFKSNKERKVNIKGSERLVENINE